MGDKGIEVFCYADDAVQIAEKENSLQRLFNKFNKIEKMII